MARITGGGGGGGTTNMNVAGAKGFRSSGELGREGMGLRHSQRHMWTFQLER